MRLSNTSRDVQQLLGPLDGVSDDEIAKNYGAAGNEGGLRSMQNRHHRSYLSSLERRTGSSARKLDCHQCRPGSARTRQRSSIARAARKDNP